MAVIYRPKHERQIKPSDPHGSVNCAAVAAAIAFDRATLGGCMLNGEDVRALSDEPHPNPASPGLNLWQLADVARKLHIQLTPVSGGSFEAILASLREGRGVIVPGDYEAMGKYSCQAGFRGDHGILVNNENTPRTSLLVYDPLCKTYRYVPTAVIRRYSEMFGAAHGFQYAYTRITPNIPAQIN